MTAQQKVVSLDDRRKGKAEAQKKTKAARIILTAEQWVKRIEAEERRGRAEAREFNEKKSYRLSVTDLRDEALGLVYSTFGHGEQAFDKVHARRGAHPSTLTKWARNETMEPRLSTIQSVALACGYEMKLVRRQDKEEN